MSEVIPSRCPVCGVGNDCAMAVPAAQEPSVENCWCNQVTIPAEQLAAIAESARGIACLCRNCAVPSREVVR